MNLLARVTLKENS